MKNSDGALVLIVDDDQDNRNLIERFITGAGYRVLSADGGASALTLLSEATPDLILLDVMMPGMNGYEFCAKLQEEPKHSSIPALAITEPANIRALFADGAVAPRQAHSTKSRATAAAVSAMVEAGAQSNDYGLKTSAGAVHVVAARSHGAGRVDDLSDVRLMSGESVMQLADRLIARSTLDRASDIHIEPKGKETVVRFRINGDMREILSLPKDASLMLVSRLKAMGGMDIAERRRPQDGVCEMKIDGRLFKLRLATTSTPDGESV